MIICQIKVYRKGGGVIINGSDRIVSMLYIKIEILASSTCYFCTGVSVSKYIENIKEGIAEFKVFKEDLGRNETICNIIQIRISSRKDQLETVIENNEKMFKLKILIIAQKNYLNEPL